VAAGRSSTDVADRDDDDGDDDEPSRPTRQPRPAPTINRQTSSAASKRAQPQRQTRSKRGKR
jgi:hypothetical protein